MIYFCDLEANGFLEEVTKIHCFSYKPLHGEVMTATDVNDWLFRHVATGSTMIFHNGSGYDLAVFEKLGIISGYNIDDNTITLMDGTVRNIQLIDSLAMSREYWPDNPRGHGLEAWAKYLGTYKPHIDDWHNLPIEDYIERCEEDVITTEKVFEFLCDKLGVEL